MELHRFGVWTSSRSLGADNVARAGEVAERLGYGTIWMGGSPRLTDLAPLLAATERITVATSIINIWAYEPEQLCQEFHALDADATGRLLVGLGISHPEANREYEKPLASMRTFLDGIAASATPIPADRLIVAALGPKMLELSGDRTLGTIPYFVDPQHTAYARARLDYPTLVAPELAVVVTDGGSDAASAKIARDYASLYLGLTNYTTNLRRFGYTDADLADGGSDRLIDAVVPQGSARELSDHVQAHFAVGADHVCVQTVGVDGVPEAQWTALATAFGLS